MKGAFKVVAAFAAVLLFIAAVSVIRFIAMAAIVDKAGSFSFAAEDAKETFGNKCVVCHGEDGTGKTDIGKSLNIVDLTSADVQKQSDAELSKVISEGKNNMPPFGSSLTQDQITALVGYIRTLGKTKSAATR